MKMYLQWIKDDGSNSSSETLIIPHLPCFEKLAFSPFHLYIEAQTMTQCFVCRNCKNNILIRANKGKEKVFYLTRVKYTYWSVDVS